MSRTTHPRTLTELRDALDGASRRGGELIVVAGGLASGKTAVITRFLQIAAATGAVTLSATGHRADSTVPLVLMEQLIRSAALSRDVESRLRTRLQDARPSLQLEGSGLCRASETVLADFGRELCDTVRTVSRVRPVVVAVDDVHFADPCSQRLLLYLWRRLCSAPVVFVLGEWVWPHPATTTFDAHLRRLKHRRVHLAPLSADDVRELAGRTLGGTGARRVAGRVADLSGGNPLLVSALLDEERGGGTVPAPDGPFAQAILTGLVRWGDELLEVAQAAAVLDARAEAETIARVLDRDPARVTDVLGVLQDAGFLDGCLFRTEVARRAVLTSLTSIQRAALNERAADVLLLAGSPATAVSGHLVEAGNPPGDDGVAALRVTAEQLVARGRPEEALKCLDLAREATDDDGIRTAVEAAALRSAWRVRPSAAAGRHAFLQPLLYDGRLSFPEAIGVLRHTTWHARLAETAAARDACVAAGRKAGVRSATEQAQTVCSWVLPPAATAVTDPTGGEVVRIDALWTARVDASATVWAENHLAESRIDDSNLEVLGTALLVLARSGQARESIAATQELLRQAKLAGAPVWQAVLSEVGARAALLAGEPEQALQLTQDALTLLSPHEWGVCLGWPLGTQALAELRLGRVERAVSVLRIPTPRRMGDTLPGMWHRRARGLSSLAQGRVLAGLGDLRGVRTWAVEQGLVPTEMVPWEEEALRAERRFLERTLRDLGRYPVDDVRPRGVSLQVLAACGDPHGTTRTPVTHRTTPQATPGHPDGAGRSGSPAPPGSSSVRPRARDEITLFGQLSSAEMRVVRLAATGCTNREIGRRLYLTVSTVEQHLTKAYRKLGVANRAGLAALHARLQTVAVLPEHLRAAAAPRVVPGGRPAIRASTGP